LLFLILQRMTAAPWRSAVVAALFALHPLRVESVAWVSERKDVLSALFWMLTLWAYVRYTENLKSQILQPRKLSGRDFKLSYALALLFFALGLMAKPMLVTLPFVLLLLDYWPLARWQRGLRPLLWEKVPFFVLAAASSVVTFLVQRHGGAVSSLTGVPLGARVGNAFISCVRYLAKIFWPARLSPLYPHPGYWPWWQIAAAVIVLAAITAWVLRRARSQPYLPVGWFCFLGMLAPTIGLVQVGIQSMADRYTYLPGLGVLIMVVWGAHEWLGPRPGGPAILGAAAALAIGACLILTPRQVNYWRNSESLFLHAVAVTDNNYLAYNNLGFDLSNRGETEQAMLYFRRSLEINSNYDEAHNNLGFALAALGRYKEATNEYIRALTLNPNLTEAHNNLGIALGDLGFADAGIHEFQVALQENPNHSGAHNNYGVALAMKGRLDEAIAQFRLAIAAQPNHLGAHSDLGNALALKGDLAGAIREYEICLGLDSKDAQVHNNLANALAQLGRLEEAAAHYRLALKLKPQNPEAHFNLSLCLDRQGCRAEAAEQCALALQQRPDYPEAQKELEALRKAP
jgi:tetratricopeptide (TPR) repeat protein